MFPKITVCSTVTFATRKAFVVINEIIKRVFNNDFNNFSDVSKKLTTETFLAYLGIADVIAVSEVIYLNLYLKHKLQHF